MAGPADNRGISHGFDGPPDERPKEIDVIGNAGVLIPELRRLLVVQATLGGGQGNGEASVRLDQGIREKIVMPIWGALNLIDLNDLENVLGVSRLSIVEREVASEHDRLDRSDVSLDRSVVLGTGHLMRISANSEIENSLLVGRTVFAGSSHNNSVFNEEQLYLMNRLAEGIRGEDVRLVTGCLMGLQQHVEDSDSTLYKPRDSEEDLVYQSKFGELAGVAKVVDNLYLKYLRGSEATNVKVRNSVVFGRNAFTRVQGGLIENSIIATNSRAISNGHIVVRNSILISDHGTITIKDDEYGDSGKAKAAVAAVKDLPLNPLLSM